MYCTGNYLTCRFQVRKLYSRKQKDGYQLSDTNTAHLSSLNICTVPCIVQSYCGFALEPVSGLIYSKYALRTHPCNSTSFTSGIHSLTSL